jgi:curved DNA-binding protein CbpA
VPSFQDDPLFDPYRVLGVSILADQEEIRHAYRILAHRFHPDTNAEDPGATHRFAEATAAYGFLRDDAARRAYDLRRAALHGPRASRTAPGPTWNTQVRGPGARPSHRPRVEAFAPAGRVAEPDPFAFARTFVRLAVFGLVVLIVGVALLTAVKAPACGPGETRGCKAPPSPTFVPGG